jgi:hypothetical protein
MERKIARTNLNGERYGFADERELVAYLLKREREREARLRRAQMRLITSSC